jgi:hypothetical protein
MGVGADCYIYSIILMFRMVPYLLAFESKRFRLRFEGIHELTATSALARLSRSEQIIKDDILEICFSLRLQFHSLFVSLYQ